MDFNINDFNKILIFTKNDLLSDEFINYVKNKKIAIVGPSTELLNKKLGEEIDSHDVVVKINYGNKLNHIDYGKKINIIYINLYIQKTHIFPYFYNNLQQNYENIKFIKLISQSFNQNKFSKNIGFHSYIDYSSNNICTDNLLYKLFEYCPTDIYKNMFFFNKHLLGGILAIIEIISCQPELVSIYGFDFYDKIKNNNNPKVSDIWPSKYNEHIKDLNSYNCDHKDLDLLNLKLFKFLFNNYTNITHLKNTQIIISEQLKNILQKYT